jgi:hypothetical protein
MSNQEDWKRVGLVASRIDTARDRFYRETIEYIIYGLRSKIDETSPTSLRVLIEMELGIFAGCLKKKYRAEFLAIAENRMEYDQGGEE